MNIAGNGSLPGGEYQEEIQIHGSGTITGNVSCTDFGISGSGTVEGDLRCSGLMKISGSGKVKGNLEAEEVNVSGGGTIDGAVRCKKATVSGSMQTAAVAANEIHVSGLIETKEDISAEDVVIHGGVKAGGLINAERLEVIFDGSSHANSIGGSLIRIRRKGVIASIFQRLFGKGDIGVFSVNGSIEGDEIDLEYVTAESVTGKNVKIGPGCRIGRVVFSGAYQCSEESEVETVDGEQI